MKKNILTISVISFFLTFAHEAIAQSCTCSNPRPVVTCPASEPAGTTCYESWCSHCGP